MAISWEWRKCESLGPLVGKTLMTKDRLFVKVFTIFVLEKPSMKEVVFPGSRTEDITRKSLLMAAV